MMRKHPARFFLSLFSVPLLTLCFSLPVTARETDEKTLPERLVSMAVEYPGVVVPPEEDVSMDVIFYNKGRSDESVKVEVTEAPDNWDAKIKTYRYAVTGLHIRSDDEKTVTFEAKPKPEVGPGDYVFRIEAKTPDGAFTMAETVTVTVKTKAEGEADDTGVELTTSYPVLRGPSDGEFEFSVEVDSKLAEDAVFDLFAKGPDGWTVNFKPAYESKYISSLRLKANGSQTVAVEVKPAAGATAGKYPVSIRVSAGEAKTEAELTVVLTGTYKIETGTATGLLSLDARRGKESTVSFYVKNTGTAVQNTVGFMSFKPENWKVEFAPETIDAVPPGDLAQVDMKITPYEDALIGDYSVTVRVEGEKAEKNMEFRVTVKASSAWGWIGIGLIVLVVVGMTALFRKLGRR